MVSGSLPIKQIYNQHFCEGKVTVITQINKCIVPCSFSCRCVEFVYSVQRLCTTQSLLHFFSVSLWQSCSATYWSGMFATSFLVGFVYMQTFLEPLAISMLYYAVLAVFASGDQTRSL